MAARAAAAPAYSAPFRVAWFANDPTNTYDNATLAGIEDIVEASGGRVDPFYAEFDPSTQLSQCLTATATGDYVALIIEANDPVGIEQCVAAAHAAGIPVAATDLPIGSDQTTVEPQVPGEVAACFIRASKFGDGVTVIVPEVCAGLDPCNILYIAGDPTFPLDVYGVQAVMKAESASIKLVSQGVGFYDTATAEQVTLDALNVRPSLGINVVIASGDQMTLGAEQAALSAGVSLRLVGAGAGATAIAAVRAGRWFATFNALPRTEGQIGAALLELSLLDPKAPPIGVDPVVVTGLPAWWTQATIAEYPNFVPQWPGP